MTTVEKLTTNDLRNMPKSCSKKIKRRSKRGLTNKMRNVILAIIAGIGITMEVVGIKDIVSPRDHRII